MQEKNFDYDYNYEIEKKALEKKISLKKKELDKISEKIFSDRLILEKLTLKKSFNAKKLEEIRKVLVLLQKKLFVIQRLIGEFQLARRDRVSL